MEQQNQQPEQQQQQNPPVAAAAPPKKSNKCTMDDCSQRIVKIIGTVSSLGISHFLTFFSPLDRSRKN